MKQLKTMTRTTTSQITWINNNVARLLLVVVPTVVGVLLTQLGPIEGQRREYQYGTFKQLGNTIRPSIIPNYVNSYYGFDHFTYSMSVVTSLDRRTTTIAIGAPSDDRTNISDSGTVQVLEYHTTIDRNSTNNNETDTTTGSNYSSSTSLWKPMGRELVGKVKKAAFGRSVAISSDGTTMIVGSFDKKNSVIVYKKQLRNNNQQPQWEPIGPSIPINETGIRFGDQVAISHDGSIIAFKLHLIVPNNAEFVTEEYVRVLQQYNPVFVSNNTQNNSTTTNSSSSQWKQIGTDIHIDDIYYFDYTTEVPSIFVMSDDGTTIAMGIRSRRESLIRVFRCNNNNDGTTTTGDDDDPNWEQLGSDLMNGFADRTTMAISGDGTRILVKIVEDLDSFYSGGDGRFRVYQLQSSSTHMHDDDVSSNSSSPYVQWVQLGSDLPDTNIYRGKVAMSSDGDTIAVGNQLYFDVLYEKYVTLVNIYQLSSSSTTTTLSSTQQSPTQDWKIVDTIQSKTPIDRFGFSIDMSADGTVIALGESSYRSMEPFAEVYKFEPDIKRIDAPVFELARLGDTLNSSCVNVIDCTNIVDCPCASNGFGRAISISADGLTIAVGSRRVRGVVYSNTNELAIVQVHHYNKSSNQWGQVGSDIKGNVTSDEYLNAMSEGIDFGNVVILSSDGTTVAIGSKNRVSVWKYSSPEDTWAQLGSDLYNSKNYRYYSDHPHYGRSMDMSADGSLIALYLYDWNNREIYNKPYETDGIVRFYMYSELSSQWEQIGAENGGEINIGFMNNEATSIVLSDDGATIAIGTVVKLANSTIRVFTKNLKSFQWEQLGADINGYAGSVSDGFSMAISANGNIVAIPTNDIDDKTQRVVKGRGRVVKFNPSSLQWEQVGTDLDFVQGAIAMSSDGNTVAIGRTYNTVIMFRFDSVSTQWYKVGIFSPSSSVYAEQYGAAIGLSADGSIVAAGAFFTPSIEIYQSKNLMSTNIPIGAPLTTPVTSPVKIPSQLPVTATRAPLSTVPTNKVPVTTPITTVPVVVPSATEIPTTPTVPISYPHITPTKTPVMTVPIITPLATKVPVKTPLTVPIVVRPPTQNMTTPTIPIAVPPNVPVPTPLSIPIGVVPLTTALPPTGPYYCPDGVVTYNWYDSRTDTIVAPITTTATNGTIIIQRPHGSKNHTNIEAVIPCNEFGSKNNSTIVELQLYKYCRNGECSGGGGGNSSASGTFTNTVNPGGIQTMKNHTMILIHSRIERYSKYFLFGDNVWNIYNGRIVAGTYDIRVIVNRTMISPFTTFTIVNV